LGESCSSFYDLPWRKGFLVSTTHFWVGEKRNRAVDRRAGEGQKESMVLKLLPNDAIESPLAQYIQHAKVSFSELN
jgi:hypothetical protein